MAIASGALCNAIPMVSFVSSNAYYGYVPLRANENLFVSSGVGNSLANNLSNGSPMETDDDDGRDYSAASCRLNNRYVIPEASTSRGWQEGLNDHQDHRNRREQQHEQQQQATQARNRKRSSADLDQTFDQATQLKRLREEAVVTAAFTVVQDAQRTMDWPRCIMSRHHYT